MDNGINGYLLELNNEDAMAQKMIDLFNNTNKLSEMSEASYKKAGFFEFDAVAQNWLALIKKVLEKKLV